MNTLHFSIKKTGRLTEISRRDDGSTYMRKAQKSPSGIMKHISLEEIDPEAAIHMANAANTHKAQNPGEYVK